MALGILSTIGAFAKNIFKNTVGKWIGNGIRKLLGNTISTASSGIGGAIGTAFSNNLVNNELTGKEREQNQFNAEQAELQRNFARDERLASQEFNAAQAQQQMDFQKRMASTQYQRSVADMQAAGINPALAMSNGIAGASAPGAMASSSPASGVAASGSAALQGLSEVIQLEKLKTDIERTKADTAKTYKESENIAADTEGKKLENSIKAKYGELTAAASYEEILSSIDKMTEEANLTRYQWQVLGPLEEALKKAQTRNFDAEAFYNEWRKDYINKYGSDPSAPWIQQALSSLITDLNNWTERHGPNYDKRVKRTSESGTD